MPSWFLWLTYPINLIFVAFGTIVYKNPSYGKFIKLSEKQPETIPVKFFKISMICLLIAILTLMNGNAGYE